ARQMTAFGGMLSFQVRGTSEMAMAVAAKVRVFTRATSFGGVESLIEHRASIEGPGTPTPDNLLRLSIGLEPAGDLIADLHQAPAGRQESSPADQGRRATYCRIVIFDTDSSISPSSAMRTASASGTIRRSMNSSSSDGSGSATSPCAA